jgi:hypothetical protein
VKLTRIARLSLALVATLSLAARAHAASGCPDDPERCVERGASARRAIGASAAHVSLTSAPALVAPAPQQPLARPAAPSRKAVARAARAPRAVSHAPSASAPPPGMGMLLKFSVGSANDNTWSAARPAESSPGTSWIL